MGRRRRSRSATRAALLASTAIIALLSACQSSGSGTSAPAGVSAASSGDVMPMGGYAW